MGNNDSARKGFDSEKVQVIKIKPYPIVCQLQGAKSPTPLECHIHRLEETGFIFKSVKQFYHVGDLCVCDFELPVVKTRISSEVKVIRTFDSFESYVPNAIKERVMTVEVQFRKKDPAFLKTIREFLNRIGQKGPSQAGGKTPSPSEASQPQNQGIKPQEKRKP